MSRHLTGALVASVAAFSIVLAGQPRPFTVVEATFGDLRAALEQRRTTSVEVVTQYLARIAIYDGALHATLAVNRDALKEAAERDRERRAGRVRGPLHGIPIALKDNIQTIDMPTTGGALVFDRFIPPYEATLVGNLRAGGAVIIAKTGMTELANWMSGAPSVMPNNYNAISGFGFNPYDPRRDPRPSIPDGRPVLDPGGSSSGIGTAASLWAGNVGTETSGSILSAANETMLVAVKPTVGRVSRHGVMPIALEQDTPGPMTRTVVDAAILLGALEGAARDPRDPAAGACPPLPAGYAASLRRDALKGARVGIPRTYFYDEALLPGSDDGIGGLSPGERRAMTEAIAVLRQQGAVVVDPADLPSVLDPDPLGNLMFWNPCSAAGEVRGKDGHCSIVLKYGMKRDFNAWAGTLGPRAPINSLTELRAWNLAHHQGGTLRYGQARLDISDDVDLVRDGERFLADREKDLALSATRGIDYVIRAEGLDALLFPAAFGSAVSARPGYPTVIVPFALVPNEPTVPFPRGFQPRPAPFGVSFAGTACSEPRLLALAYAFEQATRRRIAPIAVP